jgi:hypothetical protein
MDKIGFFTVAIALVAALGLVLSLPVMWLWNYCLVPAINGINEITWLQAWGLFLLSNLLFKGGYYDRKNS